MPRGIFVSGTDTGVGKTFTAVALLRAIVANGHRAVGMKPIATGVASGETVNADVRLLIAAGNVAAPLADVNPFSFAPPIAPELAARMAGSAIDVLDIVGAYSRLAALASDIVVEGAGGVLVPLARDVDMLDIPARLGIPVLLVVGIRLGCINHALLSALAVNARGVRLAGWIANRIDPGMREGDANVAALRERLAAPLVADFPWRDDGAPAPAFGHAALSLLGFAP